MTEDPSTQLHMWAGAFGDAYIERNLVTAEAASDAEVAFSRMLARTGNGVASILEVGANVGINLTGLRRVGSALSLTAVEPHPVASDVLRTATELGLDGVVRADGAALPFADDSFDLVFTNGVLIHVPPERLGFVMSEVARVSRRFVLCSEYFSHEPEEVTYHGQQGLLWKRDFGAAYLETVPGLTVVDYGFLWQVELPTFDDLNWWLFQIPSS